jgi:hypothetical protein
MANVLASFFHRAEKIGLFCQHLIGFSSLLLHMSHTVWANASSLFHLSFESANIRLFVICANSHFNSG